MFGMFVFVTDRRTQGYDISVLVDVLDVKYAVRICPEMAGVPLIVNFCSQFTLVIFCHFRVVFFRINGVRLD